MWTLLFQPTILSIWNTMYIIVTWIKWIDCIYHSPTAYGDKTQIQQEFVIVCMYLTCIRILESMFSTKIHPLWECIGYQSIHYISWQHIHIIFEYTKILRPWTTKWIWFEHQIHTIVISMIQNMLSTFTS